MNCRTIEELKTVFDEIFARNVMKQILSCDSKTECSLKYKDVYSDISDFMSSVSELSECIYCNSNFRKNDELKIAKSKTIRLLGMIPHHVFSLLNGINLKYVATKDARNINYRILAHDVQECARLVKSVFDNGFSDTVTLHDQIGFSTYIAIVSDEHYTGISIKRLIRENDVDDEKCRLKQIVKNNGAYYHKDMLDELTNDLEKLKNGEHTNHYCMIRTV